MDIHNLGHVHFQEGYARIENENRSYERWSSKSFFLGFINFFLRYIHSLTKNGHKWKKLPDGYNGCMFFGLTINNVRSLTPILNNLPKEDKALEILSPKDFPDWRLYHYAIPHFFSLLKEIRKADDADRRLLRAKFPVFWRMFGDERLVNEMLDLYNPKLIVVANDHVDLLRCINQKARERGIKTLYVQHASIDTTFPPLNFTYSFLDGRETLDKYLEVGSCYGNVYLSGGVRYDAVIPRTENADRRSIRIGLALNLLDDIAVVQSIATLIKGLSTDEKNYVVTVRPHPSVGQDMWEEWCRKNEFIFSTPKTESAFEFLSHQDLLIANESGIHLDAAMARVKSLTYNLSIHKFGDMYGYCKSGLIPFVSDKEELVEYITGEKEIPVSTDLIKYYSVSYGTSYEGHLAQMLARMVHLIIEGQEESFNEEYNMREIERHVEMKVFCQVEG